MHMAGFSADASLNERVEEYRAVRAAADRVGNQSVIPQRAFCRVMEAEEFELACPVLGF